jgi:hypothetical protein
MSNPLTSKNIAASKIIQNFELDYDLISVRCRALEMEKFSIDKKQEITEAKKESANDGNPKF